MGDGLNGMVRPTEIVPVEGAPSGWCNISRRVHLGW